MKHIGKSKTIKIFLAIARQSALLKPGFAAGYNKAFIGTLLAFNAGPIGTSIGTTASTCTILNPKSIFPGVAPPI